MADESSDGARVLANGIEVLLAGEPHRLVVDYESLELLEREFEGIDRFVSRIQDEQYKTERLKNVRLGLTAILLHEKPEAESVAKFRARMAKLMTPRDLITYRIAILMAIGEAMPEAPPEAPKVKGSGGSRGSGSTGSRQSASVAPTASSDA